MSGDKDTLDKVKKEIFLMKCLGNVTGVAMALFILSTPIYSNVHWVTALFASFTGWSIPLMNVFLFKNKYPKDKK